MYSRIDEVEGAPFLTFECGDLPVDSAVEDAGYTPNGYFWEGVAQYAAPELASKVEFDCEGGSFVANGPRDVLVKLQAKLEDLMADPEELTELVEDAEDAGFEFDD